MNETVAEAAKNPTKYFNHAREAFYGAFTSIIVTLLVENEASVKNSADALQQVAKALPSVAVAPNVSAPLMGQDDKVVDLGVDLATLGTATIAAKVSGSSPKELLGMGLSAQALATSFDIAAAHTDLMDKVELAQRNAGSSAIAAAFFTRFLRRKADMSETAKEKALYRAIMGVFIGSITIGMAVIDPNNFVGDIGNHAAGVAAGYFSEELGELTARAAESAKRVLPKIGRLSTRQTDTMPPPRHSFPA